MPSPRRRLAISVQTARTRRNDSEVASACLSFSSLLILRCQPRNHPVPASSGLSPAATGLEEHATLRFDSTNPTVDSDHRRSGSGRDSQAPFAP